MKTLKLMLKDEPMMIYPILGVTISILIMICALNLDVLGFEKLSMNTSLIMGIIHAAGVLLIASMFGFIVLVFKPARTTEFDDPNRR